MKSKGYSYIIPDAQGVKHVWVIQGTDTLQWTDLGPSGVQGERGPKGNDGIGLNTLTDTDLTYGDVTVTYDTTDGIGINGTMRQTFDGTNHDSMMDMHIPIVASNGISIDKQNNSEKIEIKLDDSANLIVSSVQISPEPSSADYLIFNLSQIVRVKESANVDVFFYPDKAGKLVTENSFKTLFGNKSIVGSGNIDLYQHNIKFTATTDLGTIRFVVISSKNINVDSLTDLKTLLGNTFEYPATGVIESNESPLKFYVTAVTETGYRYYVSSGKEETDVRTYSTGTWIDTVTTI